MDEYNDERALYKNILCEILHAVGSDGIKEENHLKIFELLRNAFEIDITAHNELLKQAQDVKQPPSRILVRVEIIAAKELTAKDCNDLSDPFCELHLGNESYTTSVKEKTLQPTWNETFDIPVNKITKDVLLIHVRDYNKPNMTVVEKFSEAREVHSLTGVKSFAKNLARKNSSKLIGSVKIELKSLPATGILQWFTLEKKGKSNKARGQLSMNISLSSEATNPSEESCKSMAALLETLLNNYIAVHKVLPYSWRGEFTTEEDQILAQHVVQSRVLPQQENLAKFIAFCRVHTKHHLNFQALLYPLLAIVQFMKNNVYNNAEMSLFWDNAPIALCSALTCLTKLEKIALENSEATLHLNYVLSIISNIRDLKSPEEINILPTNLCPWRASKGVYNISRGLEDTVKIGIERRVLQLQHFINFNETENKESLEKLETFIENLISELLENVEWTDEIFKLTLEFPYQETLALIVDEKVSHLACEIVTNTGTQLKNYLREGRTNELLTEHGNALFNVYHKIQKLSQRLRRLVPDARLQIENRYLWFNDYVIPRLEIAFNKTNDLIIRFVESDDFQPVCKISKFTVSAIDTLQIVFTMKTFLNELKWPQFVALSHFTIYLMSGVCDCIVTFAEEITRRVTAIASDFAVCLGSSECCRAINGIERVRQYVETFLDELNPESMVADLINCGQEVEAEKFISSLHHKVETTQRKLYAQINKIVDEVVLKEVTENTNHFLTNATRNSECRKVIKQQAEELENFLACMSKTLQNLDENLCNEHRTRVFTEVFMSAWENIVKHFEKNVDYNIALCESPLIFDRLKNKLGELQLNLVTNSRVEDVADAPSWIDMAATLSAGVFKKLHLHSMPTNQLIMAYNISRFAEQDHTLQTYGKVSIICYFKDQKLVVNILNARDVEYENSSDNCKLYVKIKLLPEHKYPLPNKLKTKNQALLQQTMVFDTIYKITMLGDNPKESEPNAMLQVILMEYHAFSSNKFVGEAFVSFSSIPEGDEDQNQMHLLLRRPAASLDSDVFKTLTRRLVDSDAQNFVTEEKRKTDNEFVEL